MKMEETLLLPHDVLSEAFKELKRKGFVYTPTNNPNDFGKRSVVYRLFGHAPAANLKRNEITLGPFPLEIDHYYGIVEEFGDKPDVLNLYFTLQKLQYEKLGMTGREYNIGVWSQEALANVFAVFSKVFDFNKPEIFESFVWFSPSKETKKEIGKSMQKNFKQDHYSLWRSVLEIEESLFLYTQEEYSGRFCKIPSVLMDKWSAYLPTSIIDVLMDLYSHSTSGGKEACFETKEELLSVVSKSLERTAKKDHCPDRELLIKEICDYNLIDYPISSDEVFVYLMKVGILKKVVSNAKTVYSLEEIPAEPKKILKQPPGWEMRAKKYLTVGSVLFSYMDSKQALE